MIIGGITGPILISIRLINLYCGRGKKGETVKLVYSDLYSDIPNETLSTALLSLHLVFRLRAQGLVEAESNEKLGALEDLLWELRPFHLQSHPALFSDAHNDYTCCFRVGMFEHAPSTFQSVRELAQITSASLSDSFHPVYNKATIESHAGNRGGRSSAFMYYTFDRKYIVKTLKRGELRYMQKHSKAFLDYYSAAEGQDSHLAKVLGLFTLHIRDKARIHVAVMENVFSRLPHTQTVFDLKGSRIHRKSLPDDIVPQSLFSFPPGTVYKDLDFLRLPETPTVRDWPTVVTQLERDSALLRAISAIDYSLLMGVAVGNVPGSRLVQGDGFTLSIGVIDYLQRYNLRKRVEQTAKRALAPAADPLDISVASPAVYQDRFIQFLKPLFRA